MEERADILRNMQICRFCLDDNGPFTSIYERDTGDGKHTVPLPLQIMACVAIEVCKSTNNFKKIVYEDCFNVAVGLIGVIHLNILL